MQIVEQNETPAADGKHFLEHMAAQLKVLNVEIIQGAILAATWEQKKKKNSNSRNLIYP